MLDRRPEFPGMDPWLEQTAFWPGFHNRLITAMADALAPLVDPRYFVEIEERVYFWSEDDIEATAIADIAAGPHAEGAGVPPRRHAAGPAERTTGIRILDVETPALHRVPEAYLEVRDLESRSVVTVIEVLSPANKAHSRGRRDYLRKRARLLRSRTNLVEIDWMRAGRPMPLLRTPPGDDYRMLISRARQRPRATLFLFSCRSPVPSIPIPLRPGGDEPALDLNTVLHDLIDRALYFRRIDYRKPPVPPLSPADADWAAGIIAEAEHLAENGA